MKVKPIPLLYDGLMIVNMFTKINPKNMAEQKAIDIRILSTSKILIPLNLVL